MAGLVAFCTGVFSHMVLGLGDSSLQRIPDEAATLSGLSSKMTQPGLYMFPYEMDPGKAAEAWKTGPHGLLIFHPPGGTFNLMSGLAIQLVTDLSIGLIMGWLFARLRPASFIDGVGYGLALAVLITLGTLVPFWNWYGFPTGFTAAAAFENLLIGSLAGGLLGYLMRPGVPVPVTRAARA